MQQGYTGMGQGYTGMGQGDPRLGQQDPRMGQQDPRMGQGYPRRGQQDPRMEQQDPRLGQQDPRMEQQDPRMGQQDPRMGQGYPRRGQQDPRMEQQDPRLGQQDPRMEQQDPRMEQQDPRMGQQDPRMGQACPGMGHQYSPLPLPAVDRQPAGYLREFRIQSWVPAAAPRERSGSSGETPGEVEIPGTQSYSGVWNSPGLTQTNPVTSTTEFDQENDPKGTGLSKTRVRTVFNEEQKRRLMQQFHRQKYISLQERTKLANTLGLNCKQVKTWYQNRRMKLKRSQYIQPPATYWNRTGFSPISSPTLSLSQGLTPTLMKPHFISYQQQTILSSGQARSFRQRNTSMEHPIVEVLQSSPIHGDLQHPSTSSYFQSFPPGNCPDPDFGGFHKEHFVIPGTQSLNFQNQVPRSGIGFPAVRIHQSPSIKDDIQCIATSDSFPLSEYDHISSSFNMATVEREVRVSGQDTQIQPDNWSPVQRDGSSSGYFTLAPVFDGYEVLHSESVNLFSEGYPVTFNGAL
ncbi:homeotic protein antennapedia-like [Scyliorhinus canicula]|uniref:homeotic protein antennapedia-like n=1 Tax=Scyliorhinus canicula TaxID=7830 RepID=UPI0018F38986|nr:homeotic protein antennapedia-like [Scyliorhinus canicula]